eukprot:TRINITY_DN43105_c0_g1_i2.p1 TRINITY_DN43105_c0_g1~~TRINITY_DN43105_c0_g1_i2.p1  ORF type:complete len:416 (-),score=86.98 TRINITY_DN43105_c0_g1_i2:160-1407(-)
MFMMADLDGDGILQIEEAVPFVRAVISDHAYGTPLPMPDASAVSPALLDRYLMELCKIADANHNGVLEREEFSQMLSLSGFEFSEPVKRGMLVMADVNGDGLIQYEEAIPYIRCMIVDGTFKPTPKLSEMPPHLLDRYLRELFELSDLNKNGVLEKDEFLLMFQRTGFELSEGMLSSMFTMADMDGDGVIQIEEAIPHLRAVISDSGFSAPVKMPSLTDISPDLLDRYLRELFAIADLNHDGVLERQEFVQMLELCGFKFSRDTAEMLFQLADVDQDGVVQLDEAVPFLRAALVDRQFQKPEESPSVRASPGNPEDTPSCMLFGSSYRRGTVEHPTTVAFEQRKHDPEPVSEPRRELFQIKNGRAIPLTPATDGIMELRIRTPPTASQKLSVGDPHHWSISPPRQASWLGKLLQH